jgi:proteasome lid subunit RPN8/RPN11
MGLRISRALQAQLLAEAAATPEREVCGLLFGPVADVVTDVRPCANIAMNPADRFEIDPAALIGAHKAERAGGPRLVGCYHSHPNGVGEPSVRDREAAWGSDTFWLIVAGDRLAAWRNTGPGAFERVEIASEG